MEQAERSPLVEAAAARRRASVEREDRGGIGRGNGADDGSRDDFAGALSRSLEKRDAAGSRKESAVQSAEDAGASGVSAGSARGTGKAEGAGSSADADGEPGEGTAEDAEVKVGSVDPASGERNEAPDVPRPLGSSGEELGEGGGTIVAGGNAAAAGGKLIAGGARNPGVSTGQKTAGKIEAPVNVGGAAAAPENGGSADVAGTQGGASPEVSAGVVEIKPVPLDQAASVGTVSAPVANTAQAHEGARSIRSTSSGTDGSGSEGAAVAASIGGTASTDAAARTAPGGGGGTTDAGSILGTVLGAAGSKGSEPGHQGAGGSLSSGAAGQSSGAGNARSGEMSALESLVARGLSASLAQRGGTMTMRLMPESLGAMRIQMDVQQGSVSVSLDVASVQAHRLLSESIDTLRASLEAKGLAVEKLGVNLTPGGNGSIAASHGAGSAHGGPGTGGNGSSGTDGQSGPRQDAGGQGYGNHDAGDGRSRSWLGGDQRREEPERPGGAGPRDDQRTNNGEAEDFGGLWRRLRLGVDTRV